MLVGICPIAWNSNKSWPQWHREREGSSAAPATQLHLSMLFQSQRTAIWSEEQVEVWWDVQKKCVVMAEPALSSVYSSVPSGCHSGLQSCDIDWIVIFAVVGAGFSGLSQLGKRVGGDCLEKTSECWQLCADTPWVVGLLIFLLLYAHQCKKFTEDEVTSFAGSLPKALQLLTAAVEKSPGAASTGVQSRIESI